MPKVSCLVVSHNKPALILEAIGTLIIQDMSDWEAIVMDSGVLYDKGFFDQVPFNVDPRIKVHKSNETEEMRQHKAMAPWSFNECYRRNLVTGELVTYLCDDDVFYPHAFSAFVKFAERMPKAKAFYASQDIGAIFPDGRRVIYGERLAKKIGGKCCAGMRMDCVVDYLQFWHRKEAVDGLGAEKWPEAKGSGYHADGLFLEKVGSLYPIYPLDIKIGVNRRTPFSINGATS